MTNYAGRKEIDKIDIRRTDLWRGDSGWIWRVLYVGGDHEGYEETLPKAIIAATERVRDIT